MPLRNSRPAVMRPTGACDAVDGSNAMPGAMAALTNLIPSPTTRNQWVPRPASSKITGFSGFTSPGAVNALLQVGDTIYGMIAETSGTYNGKDVPFAYDLTSGAFQTITIPGGAASLPASPGTSGDWTPPTMAVVGSRILVTHPGYAGGPGGNFFGWLDISGFSSDTLTGNTNTSTTINAISYDVIQAGWQPGMSISDSAGDIPAGAVIVSIDISNLDLNTTGTFNGTNQVTSLASTTGLVVGAAATAQGLSLGLVESISGTTVTLSKATTITGTSVAVNFSGGTSITISEAATASTVGTTLTVKGGTSTAPLYGAGNLNTNPLVSVPLAVAQFGGSAFFAVGNGVAFSDAGNSSQMTFATQVLLFENGLPVTALAGLGLQQYVGGSLQALVAFQGDSTMQQITGSAPLGNLTVTALSVGVGTLAPNTICGTIAGLAFIAPDGLRILGFNGQVSDPIGADGEGICYPFLSAVAPSRMCAAFNQNILRVSVQNGNAAGQPWQEWWFDFKLKAWSGPHSFPAALIVPYQGSPTQGFTLAPIGVSAALFSSSVTPSISDTFVENGTQMTFAFETVLLPDTGGMCANSMTQAMLACAISRNQAWTVVAHDEQGSILDQVYLVGPAEPDTIWGSFTWGSVNWGGPGTYFFQQPLGWHQALVFKQCSIRVTGNCALGSILGNLNMQIAQLGYLTQYPSPPPLPPVTAESMLTSESGEILTADDGTTILYSDST